MLEVLKSYREMKQALTKFYDESKTDFPVYYTDAVLNSDNLLNSIKTDKEN